MARKSVLGVTRDQESTEERRFDDLTIPIAKPGKHEVIILGSLKRRAQSWLPILRYNEQEQRVDHTWKLVFGNIPLLEKIAKADSRGREIYFRNIMKKQGKKVKDEALKNFVRSRISPRVHFVLLGFDISDPDPMLKKAPLTWGAWDDMKEVYKTESKTKAGKLRFGAIYSILWLINHKYDESSKKREEFKHSYKVNSSETPFANKMKIELLDKAPSDKLVMKCLDALTADIWEPGAAWGAFQESELDLHEEYKSATEEEVREALDAAPFNLSATDKDNIPIFPYGMGNAWVSNTFHHYCLQFRNE